jgi:hypothetical protein
MRLENRSALLEISFFIPMALTLRWCPSAGYIPLVCLTHRRTGLGGAVQNHRGKGSPDYRGKVNDFHASHDRFEEGQPKDCAPK